MTYKPDQNAAGIVLEDARRMDDTVREKAALLEQCVRGDGPCDVLTAQAELSIAMAAALSRLMSMVMPLFAFANNGGMPSKRAGRTISLFGGAIKIPGEQLAMILFRIAIFVAVVLPYLAPAGGKVSVSSKGISAESGGRMVSVDLDRNGIPDSFVIDGHLYREMSAGVSTNNPVAGSN